jgi:hypothetical protein
MAILKTLVCAVLFLVQVTNADLFVHCMAAMDADPDSACGEDLSGEVFSMLSSCSGYTMGAAVPESRRLSEGERELQDPDNGCYGTNLSGGYQMMCCWQTNNKYSYCGSPQGDRRELQIPSTLVDVVVEQAALTTIAANCTTAFVELATVYELADLPHCFGTSADVFCKTIEIVLG